MSRLIDADALINKITKYYCKNCDRRKGMKNGKYKALYEIGGVPCRACSIDDMKDEIDNAPTVLETDENGLIRCEHEIIGARK